MNKIILITNPGSASRKYALYNGEDLMASLHFEYENNQVICNIKDPDDGDKTIKPNFKDLTETVAHISEILKQEGYLSDQHKLSAIVARLVAPSDYFTKHHIVDDEFMQNLEIAKERAPLHTPIIAAEIAHFREQFPSTKIIAISDSAFHAGKPELMKYYPFDTDLADQAGIKRYGYHGLSVGSIVHTMQQEDILPEKLIIAHLGSGSSISAILNGNAMDTSMGYSPLEGLMMSTRSGSIDVTAALAIKRALNLDDEGLEKYLNKQAGLLGVSGFTDDMRKIITKREQGDKKASFAHALFVFRVQNLIGQMAASLGGVDALVFTATIGERSAEIRRYITQKLGYLGLKLNETKNQKPEFIGKHTNISIKDSKPIYIIKTDEVAEMIRQAQKLL
jgi:acetate kinase